MVEKKVIYIVSAFPCFSEAFILREMLELKHRGIIIDIFSLRHTQEPILQEGVYELLPRTHYFPFLFSFKMWLYNLYWFISSPLKYLNCLFTIISEYIFEPFMLAKSLVLFPKTVAFAMTAKNIQTRHIHAHFATFPAAAALIIHRLTGIPFSFSCHAHDIFYTKRFLRPKFIEAKKAVTVSEYNKKYIFNLFPELERGKIEILRSPVDCERYAYREFKGEGSSTILSVGRLTDMKGFSFLIQACSILKKEGIKFLCHIVGGGPLRSNLELLIKKYNLSDEVSLLGPIREEQLLEEYSNAKVFALACVPAQDRDKHDGLPAVLVEAMAIGIPVISTSISGIPELVINNVTGLLVPPKDAISLAEAIKKLYKDQALQSHLTRDARKKVEEEFNIKKNVDRLLNIFFD